ncbi:depupylase/deamidase Dop [Georgenia thermotolerans]|uniref:Proteasome accessory factor PafA2 n=1 Tax=Georgenia thermotolerans TaxID=527326 RepID=A0A7J5UKN5_9MICO|nr:depupylase/deamidase Dop [Georgenia thermotolerans]KAE8762949.1 proteasome accessory factor PafA2 [Georgenia thermotolerans]
MSVHRPMGIETEYGIIEPGNPSSNPMVLSAHVVAAYAGAPGSAGRGGHVRWDYAGEDPLADARGFRLDRASAHPSQLTDDPEHPAPPEEDIPAGEAAPPGGAGPGVRTTTLRRPTPAELALPTATNAVLTNGARLYVDHAHPEYSSPEVTNPLDAVRWDRAGELVMRGAMDALRHSPGMPEVVVYKNNVDGKGAAYGTHENYLVSREVNFGDIIRYLTPFFVTRPIFCGAGRVGLGQRSERAGYQISQRADYVENDVGLETTFNRPIINTRDEPHADAARFRRLHVIGGDANLMDVSTYLKMGTTSLVLWLLEQGEVPLELDALMLANPVGETWEVSHDVTLTHRLTLADGREMTALEIQRVYLRVVADALTQAGRTDQATRDVVERWAGVLDRLATDPADAAAEVEWVAKLELLDGMRRRGGLPWDHPKLAALDLQWSDLRPERSIFNRLVAAGRVERLVPDPEVAAAEHTPPADTRAWFRGQVVARYPGQVAGASWESVVLDLPGHEHLVRVPMTDPLRGTRQHVGALLERSGTAAELLEALTAGRPGHPGRA